MNRVLTVGLLAATFALPATAPAQTHDPAAHHQHGGAMATPADKRQAVSFPAPLREHTLANMRDHLQALTEIQAALAKADFDRAADLAEKRLGMSSLEAHGAHEVAKFMPQAMQDAGSAMHRSASRFALAAKDASASADLRPALAALSEVSGTCVACHAGFKLK